MSDDPVSWLYRLQNLGVKLGLDGIRALLRRLGGPDRAYPIALVGGTNGKGSVAAMMDAVLREAGLAVGFFSSPHLVRPHERIRLDGHDIADRAFDDLLSRLRDECERGLRDGDLASHPSFFEVVTAAGLEAFREARVDAAVVEVGLGGRLDATNATDPLVSVIVTVALDHIAQLGSSIEEIAREKAGIIREGRTLVTGVAETEALEPIRARCGQLGSPLVEARRAAEIVSGSGDGFVVVTARARYDDLRLALEGAHQRDNARTAIVALEIFAEATGRELDVDAVRRGLAATRWRGRLEWIPGSPPLLLDGAHNGAGTAVLASHLDRRGGAKPVLLFASMRDKDLSAVLRPLAERASAVVLTRPAVSRAADPVDLAAVATAWSPLVEVRAGIEEALSTARSLARDRGPDGFVLVAGSLYLVGEVIGLVEGSSGPGPVAM